MSKRLDILRVYRKGFLNEGLQYRFGNKDGWNNAA